MKQKLKIVLGACIVLSVSVLMYFFSGAPNLLTSLLGTTGTSSLELYIKLQGRDNNAATDTRDFAYPLHVTITDNTSQKILDEEAWTRGNDGLFPDPAAPKASTIVTVLSSLDPAKDPYTISIFSKTHMINTKIVQLKSGKNTFTLDAPGLLAGNLAQNVDHTNERFNTSDILEFIPNWGKPVQWKHYEMQDPLLYFDINGNGQIGAEDFSLVMMNQGQVGPTAFGTTVGVDSNNAEFLNQTVPLTMEAGKPYEIKILMKNTGTIPWTKTEKYLLGNMINVTDGFTPKRVMLPQDTVAPGANTEFIFTVTAPTTAGTYDFQWKMLKEGVEWFGTSTTKLSVTIKGATVGTPVLSLKTDKDTYSVGDKFKVQIFLNTNGITTDEVDVKLTYDPKILEVLDGKPDINGVQVPEIIHLLELYMNNSVDVSKGTIFFEQISLDPKAFYKTEDKAEVLAEFEVRALSAGSTALTLVFTEGDAKQDSSVQDSSSHLDVLGKVQNLFLTIKGGTAIRHLKVFIAAGQSNMVGTGIKSQVPANAVDAEIKHSYLLNYGKATTPSTSNGWTTLASRNWNFGPELYFGRTLYENNVKDIAIIEVATSATTLYADWAKGSTAGVGLYEKMLEYVNQQLALLTADGYTYEIAGFLWVQGEGDCGAPYNVQYETNLTNFIQNVRTDFNVPNMNFIIGRTWHHNGEAGPAVVRAAQVKVADTVSNVDWVDTDTFSMLSQLDATTKLPFLIHYDSTGQVQLGKAMASKYLNKDFTEENRVAIRNVGGKNEFYETISGVTYIPRGSNLAFTDPKVIANHSNFEVGKYDAPGAESDLQSMQTQGYNVVRVFFGIDSINDPSGTGINSAYITNLKDFILKAKKHDIKVWFAMQQWMPTNYAPPDTNPNFSNINMYYMTEAGVGKRRDFLVDIIKAFKSQNVPLDQIFAYGENEMYFLEDQKPLNMTTGTVTTYGLTYDMSNAAQKNQLMLDSITTFSNTMTAGVKSADPKGLYAPGFYGPSYVASAADKRILPAPGTGVKTSNADFLGLQAYPDYGSLSQYAQDTGISSSYPKIIVMEEAGIEISKNQNMQNALTRLKTWYTDSCSYGFNGWLLWTWNDRQMFWAEENSNNELGKIIAPAYWNSVCN